MKQGKRIVLPALILATAAAPPAIAQEAEPYRPPESLEAMITIEGTCSRLTVSGDDLSDRCNNVVLNAVYKDGRTGFLFTARDLAVATFSGDDNPAVGGQATVVLDRVVLATLIDGKANPVTLPATGTCLYSSSDRKQINISCRATTHRGSFEATFASNGKPPQMSRP